MKVKKELKFDVKKINGINKVVIDCNGIDPNKVIKNLLYLLKDGDFNNQNIDWENVNQRWCPTHKINFNIYCRACRDEIRKYKKLLKNMNQKSEVKI